MKVPLRVAGIGVLKLIEGGLWVADKLDRWLEARKAAKSEPLTFKDVQNIEKQIDSATRSRAPTVIIPRPKK